MSKKDIKINKFHIPRWNELPNIDLYLDQVVNLINSTLSPYIFLNNDTKKENIQVLTKTMINNYAKAKLFPSPHKKKYSKSHIILLILIYHIKTVLTINDICKLFAPINALLEQDLECPELDKLYVIFTDMQKFVSEHKEFSLSPEDYSKTAYDILTVLNYSLIAARSRQVAERVIDTKF